MQIISELEELIRFYGERMVGMMAPFLEGRILQYLAAHDKLRGQFQKAFAKPFPTPEKALRKMLEQHLSKKS